MLRKVPIVAQTQVSNGQAATGRGGQMKELAVLKMIRLSFWSLLSAAAAAALPAYLLAAEAASAPASGVSLPGVAPETLSPFQPLRVEVKDLLEKKGYVDWSAREVVAVGKALQVAPTAQSAAMAQRGAEIVALRNAVAATVGVRIGPNGEVANLRNGQVSMQGYVKDFKVSRTYSVKQGLEIWWVAEVRVPMFGASSMAVQLYDEELASYQRVEAGMKRAEWAGADAADEQHDDLLVIDARGAGFAPSMYPLVVDKSGRILMDIKTVSKEQAVGAGLCTYGTTNWKFQKLQTPEEGSVAPPSRLLAFAGGDSRLPFDRLRAQPWHSTANIDGLTADKWLLAAATQETSASQPASAPAKARQPRRIAVQASGATGKDNAILVVADEEALRMLKDPKASRLAQQGRVVIVLDAAGAGLEGRTTGGTLGPVASLP